MSNFEERIQNRFRFLCYFAIVFAAVVTGVFIVVQAINYGNCQNYPRMIVRTTESFVFMVASALFCRRTYLYSSFGGDFRLSRRSSFVMMLLLLISSITEAYYMSAYLTEQGGKRQLYMLVIIIVGSITILPIVNFVTYNINIHAVRLSCFLGIAASIISFFLAWLIVVTNTPADTRAVITPVAWIAESFAPIYILQIFPAIIIWVLSKNIFLSQISGIDEFDENEPIDEFEDEEDAY